MNNKYGEHPKKKICIFKDKENISKKEDKDNENNIDNENNEDNEKNEDNYDYQSNEDHQNAKNKEDNGKNEDNQGYENYEDYEGYQDNEDYEDYDDYENYDDYEDYEDNESDEIDLSVPRYSCDNNGDAMVFVIGGSAYHISSPDHYEDIIQQYRSIPKKFENVDQNQVVKKLNIHMDIKEILINDIQELKIHKFNFNNLLHIDLRLFLDEQFESEAIKFIQSILNLQSLQYFNVMIIPKFSVCQKYYVDKIQNQLEFKNHINSQQISVYDNRTYYYGFNIISNGGKIKKLIFFSFAQIKLDIQQLESVETIEMDSGCYFSYNSLNEYLKKLINLKCLKFSKHSQLQRVCEEKQIQTTFRGEEIQTDMIPIQSPNLIELDICFIHISQELNVNLFKQQLSKLKNLRILKMYISYQFFNDGVYQGRNIDESEKEVNLIRQRLIKYLKQLVILNTETSKW